MPGSAGTLLAVGGSTAAATLTITVATAPASGEVVSLYFLTDNHGGSDHAGITGVTDSRGGTWLLSTATEALIGYANDSNVLIGSVMRTAGADLQLGDTITVTWDPANAVPPHSAVIVQGLVGIDSTRATNQMLGGRPPCTVVYDNAQSHPSNDGTPTDLLWGTRFVEKPTPCYGVNVSCITLAGGIGGVSDWAPLDGVRIADTTQPGGLYLAVALQPTALDGIPSQPGGRFATPGTVLVANYQFLDPVSLGPTGSFTMTNPFKAHS